MATLAPSPRVRFLTSAAKSRSRETMTSSAPASSSASALAPLEVTARTRAPSSRASCTAWMPTPPLAPVMSTVSPARTRPRVRTTWTAVPVVQQAAAAAAAREALAAREPLEGGRAVAPLPGRHSLAHRHHLPGRLVAEDGGNAGAGQVAPAVDDVVEAHPAGVDLEHDLARAWARVGARFRPQVVGGPQPVKPHCLHSAPL